MRSICTTSHTRAKTQVQPAQTKYSSPTPTYIIAIARYQRLARAGGNGTAGTAMAVKKWRRLNSNLCVRILPQRLSQLQDVQSMTMPSLDLFETFSRLRASKLATRTGACSHHSDARPAREIWAGQTCAKFSVAHACE